MINLTEEQKQKIAIFDVLFYTASVEELQKMADLERNIQKLKGDNKKPTTFIDFINEYNSISTTVIASQMQMYDMKADIQNVVKVLNTLMNMPVPYNQDFQNLKSKYSVY
jgi:hypothetical protein